ncbi:Hint domain-containing protein [Lichenihabitans psoromatis]|uniref:Hint domain-containing protein n=1 Tax=Lichenihabitans psoromatis TaxID=2528642 RepID=UPI00103855F3|nr:Hint domain-containing protein [Lichenihabitans psoromatis]
MVDVNETFGIGQNAIGVDLGAGTVYTPVTSGISNIGLSGSFGAVGDTVLASIDTAGIVSTDSTAVYNGYLDNGAGHYTYLFSASGGGLTSTVAFAVSGAPLPVLGVSGAPTTTGTVPTDTSIVPCFASGTLIRTVRGDIAVEDLALGDQVLTLGGEIQPVTWIGSRKDSASRYAPEHRVDFWPVMFRAGSLGSNRPEQDLYVSPCHGMFVDGVRVAAWRLLNGASIVHATEVTEVEYFHIELAEHSILFANGAPAESYFEFDHFHRIFDNGSTYPTRTTTHSRFGREAVDAIEVGQLRAKLDSFVVIETVDFGATVSA